MRLIEVFVCAVLVALTVALFLALAFHAYAGCMRHGHSALYCFREAAY